MGLILPGSILSSAERACDRPSYWTAKAGNGLNYVEEIVPKDVFGVSALTNWIKRMAEESGYPIRIQHAQSGPPTEVLAAVVLNGPRFLWGCDHCSQSYRSAAVPPKPKDPACPSCLIKVDAAAQHYYEDGKVLFRTRADFEASSFTPDASPNSYPAILVFHEIDPDPMPAHLVTWWVYPEDFGR